jgi:hypothetical protein
MLVQRNRNYFVRARKLWFWSWINVGLVIGKKRVIASFRSFFVGVVCSGHAFLVTERREERRLWEGKNEIVRTSHQKVRIQTSQKKTSKTLEENKRARALLRLRHRAVRSDYNHSRIPNTSVFYFDHTLTRTHNSSVAFKKTSRGDYNTQKTKERAGRI